MKNAMFLILSIVLSMSTSMEAQLWKKFKDKTKDKLSERIVDKVENEISEDLADRAMQKIDNIYEDFWRKSYNDANDEDLSEEEFEDLLKEAGDDLNDALGELNKAADVPERYEFNVIVDYTSTNQSGEKVKSEIYFSRTEGIMGILTGGKNNQMITVMDAENDLMVIFNEKDGNKTGQAIPALFSMASVLSMTSEDAQEYRMPMKATGRTSNIAGYNSKEYIGEDDERSYSFYMSNELPFDWRASYGELIKSVMPTMYAENEQKLEGMMMRSIDTYKTSNRTDTWEVTKISKMNTTLVKHQYTFKGFDH